MAVNCENLGRRFCNSGVFFILIAVDRDGPQTATSTPEDSYKAGKQTYIVDQEQKRIIT